MKSLRDRLACLERGERATEFWMVLGDGFVTCSRTGERLRAAEFRARFPDARPFTFKVESREDLDL